MFCLRFLIKDAVHIISGGLDAQLKIFDLNNNTETLIGSHDKAIKAVEYSSKINGIVTGSWDKVRSKNYSNSDEVLIFRFPCRP